MRFNEGGEMGEVAVVSMGDTTEPVIMGKMLPPEEEDSLEHQPEHYIMGMIMAPNPQPEPENGASDEPEILPDPVEQDERSDIIPDDSAELRCDISPVKEPCPDIQ